MNDQHTVSAWQLDQDSATAYENYLVTRFFRRWANRLVEEAHIQAGERVLDAGCGTGIVARTAASRFGSDVHVTGVDINAGMLTEARRRDVDHAVSWQAGSLEELPFDDSAFDVVLSQQVLQFVTDKDASLAQIHRVLTPNGRLVLALLRDVSFNRSYEALATTLDEHVGSIAGAMMRSPFGGPDADTLRQDLKAAGFRDIAVKHDILDVRFPSPADYLLQEAASSPLAGPLGSLDSKRLKQLMSDLEPALAPFTDDYGVAFPMETHVVTAFR